MALHKGHLPPHRSPYSSLWSTQLRLDTDTKLVGKIPGIPWSPQGRAHGATAPPWKHWQNGQEQPGSWLCTHLTSSCRSLAPRWDTTSSCSSATLPSLPSTPQPVQTAIPSWLDPHGLGQVREQLPEQLCRWTWQKDGQAAGNWGPCSQNSCSLRTSPSHINTPWFRIRTQNQMHSGCALSASKPWPLCQRLLPRCPHWPEAPRECSTSLSSDAPTQGASSRAITATIMHPPGCRAGSCHRTHGITAALLPFPSAKQSGKHPWGRGRCQLPRTVMIMRSLNVTTNIKF